MEGVAENLGGEGAGRHLGEELREGEDGYVLDAGGCEQFEFLIEWGDERLGEVPLYVSAGELKIVRSSSYGNIQTGESEDPGNQRSVGVEDEIACADRCAGPEHISPLNQADWGR